VRENARLIVRRDFDDRLFPFTLQWSPIKREIQSSPVANVEEELCGRQALGVSVEIGRNKMEQ